MFFVGVEFRKVYRDPEHVLLRLLKKLRIASPKKWHYSRHPFVSCTCWNVFFRETMDNYQGKKGQKVMSSHCRNNSIATEPGDINQTVCFFLINAQFPHLISFVGARDEAFPSLNGEDL